MKAEGGKRTSWLCWEEPMWGSEGDTLDMMMLWCEEVTGTPAGWRQGDTVRRPSCEGHPSCEGCGAASALVTAGCFRVLENKRQSQWVRKIFNMTFQFKLISYWNLVFKNNVMSVDYAGKKKTVLYFQRRLKQFLAAAWLTSRRAAEQSAEKWKTVSVHVLSTDSQPVGGSDSQLAQHSIFSFLLHWGRRGNTLQPWRSQTEGHALFRRLPFDLSLSPWFTQRPPLPPHSTALNHPLEMPRSLRDTELRKWYSSLMSEMRRHLRKTHTCSWLCCVRLVVRSFMRAA